MGSAIALGARCAPFFCGAAIAAALQIPAPAFGQTARLPEVIAQNYDDDCGLAAVRMLLERAGHNVADRDLLSGLRTSSGENALTAADLDDMVQRLGLGLKLDIGWLPPEVVPMLADREPFLILMKPRSFGGADGFDHFMLVESRTANGLVVADPVLASRTQLSTELLHRDSHQKLIKGASAVMVIRLRGTASAPSLLPLSTTELRLHRWEQSYRLPRVLPVGKMQVSMTLIGQRDKIVFDESEFGISEHNNASVMELSRGIGHRSQVDLTVTRITGNGTFRLPGEAIDFGQQAQINVSLGITHIPNLALPPALGLSTTASVEWEDSERPSALTLGARLGWVKGRLSSAVAIETRFDGKVAAAIHPSIGYRLPTRQGFVFDARVAAPFRLGGGRPNYEAELAVSRRIGVDWHVSVFASTGMWEPAGVKSRRFGLTLTYGIPRRFRRAAPPFSTR